jgi:hypothetical protein
MSGSWDPRRGPTATLLVIAYVLLVLGLLTFRNEWVRTAAGLLMLAGIGVLASWGSRALRRRSR